MLTIALSLILSHAPDEARESVQAIGVNKLLTAAVLIDLVDMAIGTLLPL